MEAALNLQQFLQWLVAGGISLVAMLAGLKYGLKGLEDKFGKIEADVKEGFQNIKSELDKMKEVQNTGIQKTTLLEYRMEKVEEKIKNLETYLKDSSR